MAVRRVTIVQCDRCGRKEELPEGHEPKQGPSVTFSSNLAGESRSEDFQDLCSTCQRSVAALVDKILLVKKEEGEE